MIMLRVVLYGSETLLLTLRSNRLAVSQNLVLRRLFGPKSEKAIQQTVENWILKMFVNYHGDQMHDEMFGSCINILVGKTEGKRQLGRPEYQQPGTSKERSSVLKSGMIFKPNDTILRY
jgi:hypothetical protein